VIIFVHVPKTGGTSVRKAAAEQFGESAMLYDYGPDAPITSPIVRELIYESNEPERLAEWIRANGVEFLSGHFEVDRYRTLLPEADLVTWVRNPVDRVRSQHQHQSQFYSQNKTLEEVSQDLDWRNRITVQTGIDPSIYRVIGVLKRHDESIEVLNRELGLSLVSRHDNSLAERDALDREARRRIRRRNLQDARFVRAAVQRLDDIDETTRKGKDHAPHELGSK